jgi:tRNA(fMet)-specific endonuclease VapC
MIRCADATFLIDVTRGDPGAAETLREMRIAGEPLRSPAPAVAELLLGAHLLGGSVARKTLEFAADVEVLPIDYAVASEAARIGAVLDRRGRRLPMTDLLVGATAVVHQMALLTRDQGLSGIEGMVSESY